MPVEAPDTITRAAFEDVEVRAIDEDSRSAEFVAATENGVETFFGREYLRMSGLNAERYRKNPVVLDSHNRFEASAVIGRATIKTKNRQLVATVTFAETERAETVWQLVVGRFVKALSVGFRATEVQNIDEGETSGAGANRVEGPARVVKKWELFEISVVPVPADADSVGRIAGGVNVDALADALSRRAGKRETEMPDDKKAAEVEPKAEDTPKPEERQAETTTAAPQPTDAELHRRDVMAICPRGHEQLAERCILEGKSLDETKQVLLDAMGDGTKPVGTTEPAKDDETRAENDGEDKPDDDLEKMSDGQFLRSLCG